MGPNPTMGANLLKRPKLKGSPGKLNVILHGLFAFFQDDELTAYIPNLGSEHVYKAGNWLAETNLAEHSDLRLERVKPGTNRLRPDHNLLLQGSVHAAMNTLENHSVYATLRLPYPTYPVRSLGRLIVPAGAIGGDDKKRIIGFSDSRDLRCATVQVLTYDFASDADLRLGDHPWEPSLENGYVNLHVISEPEKAPMQDHIRHAFQATMALFVGVDLALRQTMRSGDLEEEKKERPAGVHELELQGLIRRQRWLTALRRGIKDSRDLNGIWDDPTAFDGGDPDSCPGAGGNGF